MSLLMPENPALSEDPALEQSGGAASPTLDEPAAAMAVSAAFVVPAVNLLPRAYAERAERRRATGFALGCVLAAAALSLLGWLISWQAATTAAERLDQQISERMVLQTEASKYADVPRVFAEVSRTREQVAAALANEIRWSYFLNDAALTLPADVSLQGMTLTGLTAGATPTESADLFKLGEPSIGTWTMQGTAAKYASVANTLDALAKTPTVQLPSVTNLTVAAEGDVKVVNFSLSATITEAAFSGRYAVDDLGQGVTP